MKTYAARVLENAYKRRLSQNAPDSVVLHEDDLIAAKDGYTSIALLGLGRSESAGNDALAWEDIGGERLICNK